ncbi:MAG: hypothetical protein HC892_19990 [Saprospiraceae bacterium]|nr:hypothetical protein [Saprospiraceae bacterium]
MNNKKLIGIDKNIKPQFLKWEFMVSIGLEESLALKRHEMGIYKKIRTYFSGADVSSKKLLYDF